MKTDIGKSRYFILFFNFIDMVSPRYYFEKYLCLFNRKGVPQELFDNSQGINPLAVFLRGFLTTSLRKYYEKIQKF